LPVPFGTQVVKRCIWSTYLRMAPVTARVWRRDLGPEHRPRPLDQIALEHRQLERAFNGFRRGRGAKSPLGRPQLRQRQAVGTTAGGRYGRRALPAAAIASVRCRVAWLDRVYGRSGRCVKTGGIPRTRRTMVAGATARAGSRGSRLRAAPSKTGLSISARRRLRHARNRTRIRPAPRPARCQGADPGRPQRSRRLRSGLPARSCARHSRVPCSTSTRRGDADTAALV
jgi:hypothetical protein